MYQKGDKIVYPLYGAGIIQELEDKELDGEVQTYYVLEIPVGNLKIMISASKAESLCVRFVHPGEKLLSMLKASLDEHAHMSDNWTQRYKENIERIKTGELTQVAIVFRSLLNRERERGLSTAEKKMMTTAKNIILSELMLSLDIDKAAAEEILDGTFR